MVYIPECKQTRYITWFIYQNVNRHDILHTLNLGCSFINLGESCNIQRPRCDIACLRATIHLYHGFPS